MSVPTSPEEVCNLSFDLLRHNILVTSIVTPETEEEALGARWYHSLRRALLRAFPWNFARGRGSLSRNATAPAFGYSDAYDLPNDFIGLVAVGEDPVYDYELDYQIEGDQILLDNDEASSLYIHYTKDFQTVVKFDPIFLMLLAHELAIVFASSLTGFAKSAKKIETERNRWEMKARAKNGQDNPVRVRHQSKILSRRRGVGSSFYSDGTHLFS